MPQLGRLLNPQTNGQQDQWNFNQNIPQNLVPPGLVGIWPDALDTPTGWLDAGDTVSRKRYADLFGVYGETFGPGDGSTTFELFDPGSSAPTDCKWIIKT